MFLTNYETVKCVLRELYLLLILLLFNIQEKADSLQQIKIANSDSVGLW